MSKAPAFVIGIILSIVGLIALEFSADVPNHYEELYWAFGGCLSSLIGILVIIVALLWPHKSIDLISSETGNEVSIPPPAHSDRN